MNLRKLSAEQVFELAVGGDRRAVGRLISLVEHEGDDAATIATLAHGHAGNAHVIGITGPPGSGKSTLTAQLVRVLAEQALRPGVLAVDPSSPLTGGAILGDRVRMEDVASPETFIRSMATRGHQGGLALAVPGVIRVLDAVGFDPIVIETVGVGQVEVDIAATADTAVVVATPGMGDAVQANKAGLLEMADLLVVNKADRPGANDVRRDLELMLDLSHTSGLEDRTGRRPEILMTTATTGDGAAELWDAIQRHRDWLEDNGSLDERRQGRDRSEIHHRLLSLAEARIAALLASDVAQRALDSVADRVHSPSEAAAELSKHL